MKFAVQSAGYGFEANLIESFLPAAGMMSTGFNAIDMVAEQELGDKKIVTLRPLAVDVRTRMSASFCPGEPRRAAHKA